MWKEQNNGEGESREDVLLPLSFSIPCRSCLGIRDTVPPCPSLPTAFLQPEFLNHDNHHRLGTQHRMALRTYLHGESELSIDVKVINSVSCCHDDQQNHVRAARKPTYNPTASTPPSHAAEVLGGNNNFDSWLEETRYDLERRKLWRYAERPVPVNADRKWKEDSAEAAILICRYVASPLLLRIPSSHLLDAFALLEQLRRLSQPFRFLELTRELRDRVYDLALPCTHEDRTWSLADDISNAKFRTRRFPSLLRVCRQIRAETRVRFLTTAHFSIELRYTRLQTPSRLDNIIRGWAQNPARGYLRYLRSLDLKIKEMTYSLGGFYTFALDNKLGLQITCKNMVTGTKTSQHQYEIQEHETAMEKDRQALNLKGEAIIMAIIRKPELWM
ncbi:hypothetical protein AC578_10199 [Pseudocercospora eumusae]|uniref:F-box domain-containing protein n=1 Tax=Pseudocercospora eumusae TaxID=321146 RepID=A0A139HYQ2_9PEZI|nr:hypothetical protein AC578_10199 [Pseudocercospora eumusae]